MNKSTIKSTIKIFFGCSMRGSYPYIKRDELSIIPKIIEELGFELISKHQTQNDILHEEKEVECVHIHDRDYEWLLESKAGIFEISNPSLGVGGEISDLVHMGKPILLLYKNYLYESISAYILGKVGSKYVNSTIEAHKYDKIIECKDIIKIFICNNLADAIENR